MKIKKTKKPDNTLRYASMLLSLSILTMAVSYYLKYRLPDPGELSKQLYREPVQTETEIGPFAFKYKKDDYLVEPVADYEIQGLVVSHNNTNVFLNRFYGDKVYLKDLCIVWGSNVIDDVYKKVQYISGPTTCYYNTNTDESFENFNPEKLSNNHLLTDIEKFRKKINQATIGDQIYIKGMLVNITHASTPGWIRESSTVRTDTGDGACEVVFVEDFKILDTYNVFWRKLYLLSWFLAIITAIFIPVHIVRSAYRR